MSDVARWEDIDAGGHVTTTRLRVDGGWLYRVHNSSGFSAKSDTETMCFVPDSHETTLTRRAERAKAEASADAAVMAIAELRGES